MRLRGAAIIPLAVLLVIGCAPAGNAGWTFATFAPTAAPSSASSTSASPAATGAASAVPSVGPTGNASALPVASRSAGKKTISSEQNGWSIQIPEAWRHQEATEEWPADVYPVAGAAYTDIVGPPVGSFPGFDVSARSLTATETEESFVEWLDAENVAHGYVVDEEIQIIVDGLEARLQRQTLGGENIWEVLAFNSGRVYLMYWIGLATNREREEPLFREFVDSFRFID